MSKRKCEAIVQGEYIDYPCRRNGTHTAGNHSLCDVHAKTYSIWSRKGIQKRMAEIYWHWTATTEQGE